LEGLAILNSVNKLVSGNFLMTRFFKILFVLTTVFSASCSIPADKKANSEITADTTTDKQTPEAKSDFRQYIKKFKPVSLPFVFRYSDTELYDFEKMFDFDPKSSDSLFLNPDYGIKCFGILPDTTKYFSLLYFFAADSYYPALITYTKDGKQIDRVNLIVNGCGGDCGLKYCSENGIINKDLSIFCSDTIKYDFSCDSLGEPIPNTSVTYINSKTGVLTDSGKIKISKDKHQEVKNSH
jgi:hypothetical protein